MGTTDRVRLSKRMSYFLRHHPEEAGLEPDAHGFVPLGALARACAATPERVREVARRDPKGRFEVQAHSIRAVYGHSYEVLPPGEPCVPPDTLYHGTPRRSVPAILREGLRPMDRQMVHLSPTVEQAREVGRRRDAKPAVLVVDAEGASRAGIDFRRAGEVYLAEYIPPEFISIFEE